MMKTATLVLVALLLPAWAFADAKAGEKKAQLCLLCHKVANTTAPLSLMPLLEAQPARYLYVQTRAFKENRRSEPSMQANVANLTDRDIRDIADYLATLKPLRAAAPLDPAKVAAGKAKADELGCATCHQPTFRGADTIPRLAGQTSGYVKAQLEAFGAGRRKHGTAPAVTLTEDEMDALAQFTASLD